MTTTPSSKTITIVIIVVTTLTDIFVRHLIPLIDSLFYLIPKTMEEKKKITSCTIPEITRKLKKDFIEKTLMMKFTGGGAIQKFYCKRYYS